MLVVLLATGSVAGQTVCDGPPWLGTDGPELCVEITDDGTGATYTERFPTPAQPGPIYNINEFIGNWSVNLNFEYAVGAGGMAVTITGDAERVAPGTGWLNVLADGGTNTGIEVGTGSLWLDGTATGISSTVVGGAAGSRTQLGGDVQFVGFPQVVQESTLGPGDFHGEINEIPVDLVAVAVHNHTGFNINEVGDSVHIPGGTIAGDPPPLTEAGGPWDELSLNRMLGPLDLSARTFRWSRIGGTGHGLRAGRPEHEPPRVAGESGLRTR